MPLPSQLFAPSFRHQHLGRYFAVIVGILVYVATFAMTAEVTLWAVTFTWDQGMENRLTIEIPAVDDETAMPQADRVKQALAVLHAMPDVARTTQLTDDDVTRLLKPWINQPELLRSLPIPALIDVERKTGSNLTAADIETRLKSVVSDAHVDDHATWLADARHLVRGLAAMAGLMILLTGLTLVIAVSLVCRAIMSTERDTISLLHTLGAEDEDIALHFEYHARRLATRAALTGFLAALLSAGALIIFLHPYADTASLQILHWVGLGFGVLLVPALAIWIAAFSARHSALKILHGVP